MRLRYTDDVARGDWVRERLGGWSTIAGMIPRGFDAYARVLHPVDARLRRWENGRPVAVESPTLRWRDIAERCGTVWHPVMQWSGITAGHRDPGPGEDGWQYGNPMLGQLPLDELAIIADILAHHTATPDAVTAGLWEGYGWMDGVGVTHLATAVSDDTSRRKRERILRKAARPVPPAFRPEVLTGPRLELPGRTYFLFEGKVRVFEDPNWTEHSWGKAAVIWKQTPNLLWPEDRAWFLASEIDFDSTLIGGTRTLIDELVASSELEAVELPADASLASDGDTINP